MAYALRVFTLINPLLAEALFVTEKFRNLGLGEGVCTGIAVCTALWCEGWFVASLSELCALLEPVFIGTPAK